ncbi:MAG: hypothetical protein NT066_02205 [Candidatus Omnitrophica bacterium]|nr:hypothetical protein [Candidatus Omnitrophota bacterium]
MIEINLLPEELRIKAGKKKAIIAVELKYFLYFIPLAILGLLICSHICLFAVYIFKNGQLGGLNKKYSSLEPQRKVLDAFNKEYAIMSEDALAMRKFADQRIIWSEKLNKLSLHLPSGIWFSDLFLTGGGDFTLRGSVISLRKEEVKLLKEFIDSLKSDTVFFKSFNKIELASVQRETISGYDMFNFVLVGTLNTVISPNL